MEKKLMKYLWRLNNLIDTKVIRTRAWLTSVFEEPWDDTYDNDIIERLWKEKRNG